MILRLAALLASSPFFALAQCAPETVDIRGDNGVVRFTVEIADDDAERAKGLMFVESMPRFEGMLFLFDRPLHAGFWMRNTLIPLDMLFIGPDGTVKKIHENAEPLSERTIDGGEGVAAVLEINGGLSEMLGIEEGAVIRHPFFGADAVWACE